MYILSARLFVPIKLIHTKYRLKFCLRERRGDVHRVLHAAMRAEVRFTACTSRSSHPALTFSKPRLSSMPDNIRRCFCKTYGCNGTWIKRGQQRGHESADLRIRPTTIPSAPRATLPVQTCDPLGPDQDVHMEEVSVPDMDLGGRRMRTSTSDVEQAMLDNGTLTWDDIELSGHDDDIHEPHPLGPIIQDPSVMIDYIDYYTPLNSVASSSARVLTSAVAHDVPHNHAAESMAEQLRARMDEAEHEEIDQDDEGQLPPIDVLDPCAYTPAEDEERNVEDGEDGPIDWTEVGGPDVDDPDPFQMSPEEYGHVSSPNTLPSHLLAIYAIVSWLHLKFHLPRAGCNALLWTFAIVLTMLCPQVRLPRVTLSSCNIALGLDRPVHILAVCPGCKEVYPDSPDTPQACTRCEVPLFIDSRTQRGHQRARNVPIIRYPYMSLSAQLSILLSVPGFEDMIDEWRKVSRRTGLYQDIFDGEICKNLKGPDGKLFFDNRHGAPPNGELRMGLQWGIDW